jgi:hypothetical protein
MTPRPCLEVKFDFHLIVRPICMMRPDPLASVMLPRQLDVESGCGGVRCYGGRCYTAQAYTHVTQDGMLVSLGFFRHTWQLDVESGCVGVRFDCYI